MFHRGCPASDTVKYLRNNSVKWSTHLLNLQRQSSKQIKTVLTERDFSSKQYCQHGEMTRGI